jgi:hypothetical protein
MLNKKKSAVPPEVLAKIRAENAALAEASGDRSALRALINDAEFKGMGGSDFMRLFLPGGGTSKGKASASMDNFYSQADFSGKRSEELLKSLLSLNQPGNSSSAAAAGGAQDFAAGQKATGATSKLLNDLGQKGLELWKNKQGGGLADSLADIGAGSGSGTGAKGYDLAAQIMNNLQ